MGSLFTFAQLCGIIGLINKNLICSIHQNKEKSLEAKKDLDLLKEFNIGGCNDFKIAEVISNIYEYENDIVYLEEIKSKLVGAEVLKSKVNLFVEKKLDGRRYLTIKKSDLTVEEYLKIWCLYE